MNNLAKVLIGVGVTAVGIGVATYYGKKLSEKKKEETVIEEFDEQGNPVVEAVKEESFMEKIRTAAYKKAVKILAWVIVRKDKIEAVATMLGLASAILGVITRVRDLKAGNDINRKLDEIIDHNNEFRDIWNKHMEHEYNRHDEIMNKLNDIHLDMGMIHEIQEMLVTPVKKKKVA